MNLREASLREANLSWTNLTRAKLAAADLGQTELGWANLNQAELGWASLSGAVMLDTVLAKLDLRQVKGLEEVLHAGPSSVSTSTHALSQGQIPESFLRGCGLQNWEIAAAKLYDPSLSESEITDIQYRVFSLRTSGAMQFYSAFISYSHQDKPFACRLHDQLQARGIRCWRDEKDLKVGVKIVAAVFNAIRTHDKLILCCSKASLTSSWVEDEIDAAVEREREEGRTLFLPLNLDGFLLDGWQGGHAPRLRGRLATDFTGWESDNAKFEKQFEKVVEALRATEE